MGNKTARKPVIGYTTGVFDLFHIGHVNILRNAKSMCDHLIVGVSTDELVREYKNKTPVIPYDQRVEVVRACKYADTVIPQYDMDKLKACLQLKADVVFVGGWHGTEKWNKIESQLKEHGIKVVYFPYTVNVSSTLINKILDEKRDKASAQNSGSKDLEKTV